MTEHEKQERYARIRTPEPRPRRPGQLPPGRHGLSPEEVARSQRARILTAVTALVGEVGYDEVTVTRVIERAGVARNTFYAFFGDRKDALVAAYDEHFERLLALVLEVQQAPGPWEDRVGRALEALLAALAADPPMARLCFVDILAGGPNAVERRNESIRRLSAAFDPGGGDEPRSGTGLPALTSLSIVGGLAEILYREISAGRTTELPGLLAQLTYLATAPYDRSSA